LITATEISQFSSIDRAKRSGPSLFRVIIGLSVRVRGRKTMDFLSEFWTYLQERKKFWLLPFFIVAIVFGGLVVLTKGSAIAPFIYTLF
jgi:Family of unknown function (DUF5989)